MNILDAQKAQLARTQAQGAVIGGGLGSAPHDWQEVERMSRRMNCLQLACSSPFVQHNEQPETTTARAQKFYDFVSNPGAK